MRCLLGWLVAAVLAATGIGVIAGCAGCSSSTSAEPNASGEAAAEQDTVEQVALKPSAAEPNAVKRAGAATPGPSGQEARNLDAMAAIEGAAKEEKYLFAFFRKEEDAQTVAMRAVLKEAIAQVPQRANFAEVDVTASSQKAVVEKFDLDRAPMPMILALAPNGAITGAFPGQVKKEQLVDAFASPATEKCMKQLQANRLVFLCVQNGQTQSNDVAMSGVRQFKADARFAQATEIILLDPADPAEKAFLGDLGVDPKIAAAVTLFLAPPGIPVAKIEGETSKEALVAALQQSSSACGPGGCGPGGCGPGR